MSLYVTLYALKETSVQLYSMLSNVCKILSKKQVKKHIFLICTVCIDLEMIHYYSDCKYSPHKVKAHVTLLKGIIAVRNCF